MLSKAQLLEAIAGEVAIVRHLARKVPAGTLDWRPSPGQRSTIELLRYLSTAGVDLTRAMLSGTWDVASVTDRAPKDLPAEAFDAAMARQGAAITALLDPIPEEEFSTRLATLPTNTRTNLGAALVAVVLRALVAYRMQLFLYAKASGASSLSTWDCWYGVDAPAPAAAER
jgi:hypothetical protein